MGTYFILHITLQKRQAEAGEGVQLDLCAVPARLPLLLLRELHDAGHALRTPTGVH